MDIADLIAQNSGIKLDIGCGANKQEGWIGMDIRELPGVDIVHDVEMFPWPLPDDCVSFAIASHLIEHINPHKFGFVNFMNEVWRVMQHLGRFAIVVPHGRSDGFIQDPTHCNPCNEATFGYFAPEHPSRLWTIYQPKPWRILSMASNPTANMEVILAKVAISEDH